ncbi:iron complex transport system substrate-binding protein [Cryobacterium sp. MP_3.1]|uniref:ABC transporter substrate-binding protein n=1 Tax=Cryobacterium sp. MP_3.1 TaxID=3071711 RepID=UPI002E006A64|nr:iron complex transport system substrate-binding protein [Cryobacterium sp. MP_3.1]
MPAAAVGLSPSQTELMLRLGLDDRVVGQAQVGTAELPADVAEQAAGIPVLSDDAPPTREILLGAEPDFVYSPTGYEFTAEQGFASIAQLEQAGVTAYTATGGCLERRNAGTVDDIFTDIDNLGRIFDVPEAAQTLTDRGRADLDAVEAAIAGETRLSVAQLYVDGSSLSAIGAGVEYDMIALAGGENVYSPDDAAFADFFAASISPESLAAENPEAIVFAVSTEQQAADTEDYLRATFPNLAAVQNDRLISISAADVFPGTLGNIRVVQQLAAELYPTAF